MKKDNFADFRYRLVESTIINHKAVEVTYRYNGKVIKRYVFVKEAPGVDYIKYAQDVINNELNGNKLVASSKELAKPSTSHKALKIALATSLTLGGITFGGLYAWKHFQNIADQHSIVVNGVTDKINALNANSTDKDIEAAIKAYDNLTDEEKAALPQETKDYLQEQVALNERDHDTADELFETINGWSPVPPHQTLNANHLLMSNAEVYPTKNELFKTMDKYDGAPQRAKDYFYQEAVGAEDSRKAWDEIAKTAKKFDDDIDNLVKSLDSSLTIEEIRELLTKTLEEVEKLDDSPIGDWMEMCGYVDIANAYTVISTVEEQLSGDLEKAKKIVNLGLKLIDNTSTNPDIVEVDAEVIGGAANMYASSSRICRNLVDKSVAEEGYSTYMDLIRDAYNKLDADRILVIKLFDSYNAIEKEAYRGTTEIRLLLQQLVALRREAQKQITQYPRVGKFATQYNLLQLIEELSKELRNAENIVTTIVRRFTKMFPHSEATASESFLTQTEDMYDKVGTIAQNYVDQGIRKTYQEKYGFENFADAMEQAWADYNSDVDAANAFRDRLNSLISDSETLPIDETDPLLVKIRNDYKTAIQQYPRIEMLARTTGGYLEQLNGLLADIAEAKIMLPVLKDYNDEASVVSGETYVSDTDIDKLNDRYRQGSLILQKILDKTIYLQFLDGEVSFSSWEVGIQSALKMYDSDKAEAMRFVGQLRSWSSRPPLHENEIDALTIEFKNVKKERPRAALIANQDELYPFEETAAKIRAAVISAKEIIARLKDYVDFNNTTCTDEDIDELDKQYKEGGLLLQNAVNSQFIDWHPMEYETWDDAIKAAKKAWEDDDRIGTELNTAVHTVMTSINADAAATSAYHIIHDENFNNLNARRHAYIKDYSSFTQKYVVSGILNNYHVVTKAEDVLKLKYPTDRYYDPVAGDVVDDGVYLEPNTYADICTINDTSLWTDSYAYVLFSMKMNWSSTSSSGPTIRITKTVGETTTTILERVAFIDKNKYVSFKLSQADWADIAEGAGTLKISLKATGIESVDFTITDFFGVIAE